LGFEHVPVEGLQVPAAWHGSSAVHTTGLEPVQAPLWQVSVSVHASPSSQAVPSAALGFEHVPVDGSHTPAAWHGSAWQAIGFEPVQAPLWQVSVSVHASPSSQAVPSAAMGFEHVPVLGSQVPATWHGSSGMHGDAHTGVPPVPVVLEVVVLLFVPPPVLPPAFTSACSLHPCKTRRATKASSARWVVALFIR
jgi:hypothetical protein